MATKRKNSEEDKNPDGKKLKTDDVLDFITCSVCREIILPPIMQCTKGHLICMDCKKKCTTCPQCRGRMGHSRNFAFEKIVSDMLFPCKYENCKELVQYSSLKNHYETCKFKPYDCYKNNCGFQSTNIKDIIEHLKVKHSLNCVKLNNSKITLEFSEKHTDDNSHNQQQVLESFEIAIDNANSLLDFLSFPIRSDRAVRRNQTTNITWSQILIEHKDNTYVLFFEKTNVYKIYLAKLTDNSSENKVKISINNNNNKLEWTTNVNSFIELENQINMEILSRKCNSFVIPISTIQQFYIPEKILINLEFL